MTCHFQTVRRSLMTEQEDFYGLFRFPVTLASDEVWLMSDSPFGFDSRYLGTAKLSKCYKALPLLTF